MQVAAFKDTTKINSLVQKSDSATPENTSKQSLGAAQYSKEKWKSSRSEPRNAYPDNSPYENSSD